MRLGWNWVRSVRGEEWIVLHFSCFGLLFFFYFLSSFSEVSSPISIDQFYGMDVLRPLSVMTMKIIKLNCCLNILIIQNNNSVYYISCEICMIIVSQMNLELIYMSYMYVSLMCNPFCAVLCLCVLVSFFFLFCFC